ncbi:MAG: type II secretion system F family protein [Nitrospinota bacterium]
MPIYEYLAYDSKGTLANGVVDAESEKLARIKLRKTGLLVSKISRSSSKSRFTSDPLQAFKNNIGAKHITAFTRQLATLQRGKLPIIESLDILLEQTSNLKLKEIISAVREKTLEGSSLADALAEHPKYFDPLYINLIKAGEVSGSLSDTLDRLATHHEYKLEQKTKVLTAMVYPSFILGAGSIVLLFLLTYVTPKVEMMFEDMKAGLPVPTIILLKVSDLLNQWWPLLIIMLAGSIFFLIRYRSSEKGRKVTDGLILKTPLFGRLVHSAALGQLARTMSTLLIGGVPLLETLKVASKIMKNVLLREVIEDAIISITEGNNIADPLKKSELFPPMVTQMIAAGERTGQLPDMLEKIADAYDFEVDASVKGLIAALEPITIILIAIAIGFIVIAILLPIFELSQVLK